MTADAPRVLLIATGEALHGALWQSAMARDLGVAVRTMQRWAAGEIDPPARIVPELRALVADRRETLSALDRRLAVAARAAA